MTQTKPNAKLVPESYDEKFNRMKKRKELETTTNPCFAVPWEIAFEYGSDRTSNAWIITDGCVSGFPESEKRVGIILRDLPVDLAKHLIHAHNRNLKS